MRELAHVLLHEPNSLTPGERELIATYVSSQNDCYFCQATLYKSNKSRRKSERVTRPGNG
jgi:alkylhydroperoxidase family enzyme